MGNYFLDTQYHATTLIYILGMAQLLFNPYKYSLLALALMLLGACMNLFVLHSIIHSVTDSSGVFFWLKPQ